MTPKSADGLGGHGGRPHIALDTTLRTRLRDISLIVPLKKNKKFLLPSNTFVLTS